MADEIISRADANAQGLKRYFTGLACRNGHVDERYVKDGKCVLCGAIRAQVWDAKNPEKRRSATRRWRDANPEQFKASSKASKQKNQQKYTDRQREAYKANPEPFKAAWARYYKKKRQWHIERGRRRRTQSKGAGLLL